MRCTQYIYTAFPTIALPWRWNLGAGEIALFQRSFTIWGWSPYTYQWGTFYVWNTCSNKFLLSSTLVLFKPFSRHNLMKRSHLFWVRMHLLESLCDILWNVSPAGLTEFHHSSQSDTCILYLMSILEFAKVNSIRLQRILWMLIWCFCWYEIHQNAQKPPREKLKLCMKHNIPNCNFVQTIKKKQELLHKIN